MEVGRVDRLLQVQPAVDVPQEDVQRPLLLLVAAGSAVREPRLAAAQHEPGRERRARSRARLERRRQTLLEPEHLRARAERPAERRDHRRALQPAARRRRREEVAEAVGDVEVHGVAARRLSDAQWHRVTRRVVASGGGRARGAAPSDASSSTSVRRSSLYSVESSVSSGTGSASPYERVAVGERELRALRDDMDELLLAHVRDVEAGEQRELLQADRALAPRPGLAHGQAAVRRTSPAARASRATRAGRRRRGARRCSRENASISSATKPS